MKFIAAFTVFVFAILAHHTNALCNTCSGTTGLACVDKNAFKVCTNGIPTSDKIVCPGNLYCTPNPMVCDPNPPDFSCNQCNLCNDNQLFACSGYNSFQLCLGNGDPDNTTTYTCPQGLVCSLEASFICVNPTLTGIGATCPWKEPSDNSTGNSTGNSTDPQEPSNGGGSGNSTVQPPTVPPPTPNGLKDPDGLCKTYSFPGRYDVSADPTCKKYVSCVSSGNGLTGSLFECPDKTYFNAKTQMCGISQPERCPLPTTITTVPTTQSPAGRR